MSSPLTLSGVDQARTDLRRPAPPVVVRRARPSHGTRRPASVHRIEWIDDPARFAALREQWDWLAARQPSPFGRHAWYSAWWNAFGFGGELRVCAVWRAQRLVAALPLWRRGGALRAMANVHTPVFEVPACDHKAREAAFAAALDAAPGVLEIEALASTDSALPALDRDSREERRVALVESLHTSPIIDLSADFAAYKRLHPTRFRKLAKLERRMRRDHEASVALARGPHGPRGRARPRLRARGRRVEGRSRNSDRLDQGDGPLLPVGGQRIPPPRRASAVHDRPGRRAGGLRPLPAARGIASGP